jgi:polar amino acid transport system substrate-binding protein
MGRQLARTVWKNVIVMFCLLLIGANLGSSAIAMTKEEAARVFEKLSWYTEEYPPYNFADENGQPTGMAVDILLAAFGKLGVKLTNGDLKIVSWNRSYKYVQEKPGTALFSMTYTPERQKIMSFVGPAIPLAISVIAPKKRNIVTRNTNDMRPLTIGVVRNDIGDQLIGKTTIPNGTIRRMVTAQQLYGLLENGKVDVVIYAVDVFKNVIRNEGGDPSQYEETLVLSSGQTGYAFHKSTDPEALMHLQQAIDELKSEGAIKKIISSYNE